MDSIDRILGVPNANLGQSLKLHVPPDKHQGQQHHPQDSPQKEENPDVVELHDQEPLLVAEDEIVPPSETGIDFAA